MFEANCLSLHSEGWVGVRGLVSGFEWPEKVNNVIRTDSDSSFFSCLVTVLPLFPIFSLYLTFLFFLFWGLRV